MAWGILLLLPFTTFSTATFSTMLIIGSEGAWGFGMLLFGIFQIAALRSGRRGLRRALATLACGFWLFVAFVLFLSGTYSAGIATSIVVSAFAAWAAGRIALGGPGE